MEVTAEMATNTPINLLPVSPKALNIKSLATASDDPILSSPNTCINVRLIRRYTTVIIRMLINKALAMVRVPDCVSAEMYAASFHPPKVNSTNTIAKPKEPELREDEDEVSAMVGVFSGVKNKPAITTKRIPPTSTV